MADPGGVAALRERFDGVTDHTVGVEEELMLLDPDTLDLLPGARARARRARRAPLAGRPAAPCAAASRSRRALATERGPHGVVAWLADAFLP